MIESQDEDPLIRQIYEEELRKNGVSSRHLKTQSTSVKEIKVNKKHFQFAFMIATLGLVSQGWARAQRNLPPEVVAYADTILYNGKVLHRSRLDTRPGS